VKSRQVINKNLVLTLALRHSKIVILDLPPLCFEHFYVIPVTEYRWKCLVRLVTEFECDMPEPVF